MADRYKVEKKKSPIKAIREFCIECMGGRNSGQNVHRAIEKCPSQECALFEFRFGKNPHRKPKSDEAMEVARKNFEKARGRSSGSWVAKKHHQAS